EKRYAEQRADPDQGDDREYGDRRIAPLSARDQSPSYRSHTLPPLVRASFTLGARKAETPIPTLPTPAAALASCACARRRNDRAAARAALPGRADPRACSDR